MSGNLNKVMIIGRLTKDPEIRAIPSGTKVANFSVATNESYTDKEGNKKESTEYHRLVAWGKLVDIIEKYLKKGDTAYFEGKLTTRSWDDPKHPGEKKYSTEIIVYSLQLLGGKRDSQGSSQGSETPGEMPPSAPDGDPDLPF